MEACLKVCFLIEKNREALPLGKCLKGFSNGIEDGNTPEYIPLSTNTVGKCLEITSDYLNDPLEQIVQWELCDTIG